VKRHLFFACALLGIFAVLLSSCVPAAPAAATTASAVGQPSASSPTQAPAKKIKVGIVMSGVINDLSWNQSLYEGAKKLADAGVIELSYTENMVAPADAERILRRYADEGYDLVFGHSATYKDAMFKVAKEYPNVNFAYSAGGDTQTLDNLAPVNQPHQEPAYLIGMLAAGMSKTGKLAGVGGIATPGAKALFKAFEMGAKEINPNVTVETVFTGDFVDIAKAKSSALALADRGFDYFIANGDGPARGSIEAARDRKLYATGFMMDMSPLAPSTVLASMYWDSEKVLSQMVTEIQTNKFRPAHFYPGGVAENVYYPKINTSLQSKIPADLLKKVEDKRQQIISGAFKVPFITD
jgi:basic membrane protein A and related proteins